MTNKKLNLSDEIPELTRVSSKGQVVIPLDLRKKLKVKEGSVLAVSSYNGDMLIMKRIDNPVTNEDLMMAKEAEEAWKEIEKGECKEYDFDKFLHKLDKK